MLHLGLALTLASACVTNVGFLLRHRGALAAPDVDVRHPLQSAAGLFRSKWWSIGYVCAFVAYALHVGALALAPLSIVQAVLAGGLVLLGVIAERFFGFHLGRREWTGVVLAAVGLAFLTLTSGGETGGDSASYSMAAMLAWESALVGVGTLLIVAHRSQERDSRKGILLGVAAGLLFTVSHVAVKAATGNIGDGVLHAAPFVLVALAAGIGAFFASARSLQIGEGVAVIAVTSIASNASSIPAGIVVFGDPLGEGVSVVLRSLAFLLVVVAATLIPGPTRSGEASRGRGRGSPEAVPT